MAGMPVATAVLSSAAATRAIHTRPMPAHHTPYAMFSSILGGIVTDPALMLVPLDDHQVTRGHSVFDTCNIVAHPDGNGASAYALTRHIERLLNSCAKARIDTTRYTKAQLRDIVLHTMAAAGKRSDVFVRMWMSAGRGDFNITPDQCVNGGECSFHVVVHLDVAPHHSGVSLAGFTEATVDIPLRGRFLATMKSTNYLVNAVCAIEARKKGGHYGLQLDEKGNIGELSIGSVGFVGEDGVLRSPKLDRVLRSTTLIRAWELLPELVERKVIKGFEFCDLTPADALASCEMFEFGGHGMQLITHLDGHKIGYKDRPNDAPPVFVALATLVAADLNDLTNTKLHHRVPFELYEGVGPRAGACVRDGLARLATRKGLLDALVYGGVALAVALATSRRFKSKR